MPKFLGKMARGCKFFRDSIFPVTPDRSWLTAATLIASLLIVFKIFLSAAINSSPSSLSCITVDLSRVLTLFSAEQLRSAVHELIGMAKAIEYALLSSGNASTR